MSIERKIIKEVLKILSNLKIEFILIGGSALELQKYKTETMDIDLIIAPQDFKNLEIKLKKNPHFQIQEFIYPFIGVTFISKSLKGGIDLEFLNSQPFAGEKGGKEFFDYVKKYHCLKTKLGAIAKPEVVWYLRLVNPSWEIYLQKILREIKITKITYQNIFPKVVKIGSYFKTDKIIKTRINKLKERI